MLEGFVAYAGIVIFGTWLGYISDQNSKILRKLDGLVASQALEMSEVEGGTPPSAAPPGYSAVKQTE